MAFVIPVAFQAIVPKHHYKTNACSLCSVLCLLPLRTKDPNPKLTIFRSTPHQLIFVIMAFRKLLGKAKPTHPNPVIPAPTPGIHPEFQNCAKGVYGVIVHLVGTLYEPLYGGPCMNDEKLVKILDWGNNLYTGKDSEAIARGRHPISDREFLLMLEYTPLLVMALPQYVTAEVAKEMVLDPIAEAWALGISETAPIMEEEAFLNGRRLIGRDVTIPSSAILTEQRGTKKEAALFKCMVALVIRSLRRFSREAKKGGGQGQFKIQPAQLDPVVMDWAETWVEWWTVYGSTCKQ
jgi:hypothetical protein